jgi:hypothetical protein
MPMPVNNISPRNQIILTVSAVVGMIGAVVLVRVMGSNIWALIAFFGAQALGIAACLVTRK